MKLKTYWITCPKTLTISKEQGYEPDYPEQLLGLVCIPPHDEVTEDFYYRPQVDGYVHTSRISAIDRMIDIHKEKHRKKVDRLEKKLEQKIKELEALK